MDNKAKQGTQDDIRIDVHQEYELHYWSEKLSISKDRLKEIVRQVGPLVEDVQKALIN